MKKNNFYFIFIIILLCYITSIQAQAQFSDPKYIISTLPIYTPTSIYSIDLDGDGDMDVLSATSNNKIVWYENDGSGIFGAQQVITTSAYGAKSVYASDLDGDGDPDVLSASYNDSKIAWYENDGFGSFGPQQVITTSVAGGANTVYASDFDGDGDMDVLSASFYSPSGKSNIVWYENDGSGSFDAKVIAISTTGVQNVYVSDLDNDGDMDVLAAFSCNWDTDMIAWYENDGSGSFAAQQVITISVYGAKSVYASDLDGDGDMDVLSASSHIFEGKIAWCENDGSGNFGEQKVITTSALGAVSVCAFDLDGDNDMDVLSASYGDNKIAWYENDGSGSFGEQKIISNSARGGRGCVYASDLDGDGDMDVLSASIGNFKISWHENDDSGNFENHEVTTTPASIYGVKSVYASDLDSDGDMDVLSASEDDDKIAWYENDGSGNFKNQKVISTFADQGQSVYASDLDGDGDMDVLSASAGDGKIAWYENDGSGSFGVQQVISASAFGAVSVYSCDLDGDDDMDVLSASEWDHKIAWYENDGSGGFAVEQVISTFARGAKSVYASDLDGDGDLDVLSASYRDHKIAWYENDGSGSFADQKIITTLAWEAESVYASDLDGDGDMDVLSASYYDNKIAWYENKGSGNFGVQQVITSTAWGAQSIYACDLDNDGDMDVISASFYDNKIAWYENDGSGRFDDQLISTSAEGARSVYACDLDGDGDLDVLSAYNCSYGGKIVWYENLMGSTGIKNNADKPVNFTLLQNYPNPFNPKTIITYELPITNDVELTIYNLTGQKVETLVSEKQNAGYYQVEWNASGFASGIYYYQIKAGQFQQVKKMVLMK